MANAIERKHVSKKIIVGISSNGSEVMTNASDIKRNDRMSPLMEIMMLALVVAKAIRSRCAR